MKTFALQQLAAQQTTAKACKLARNWRNRLFDSPVPADRIRVCCFTATASQKAAELPVRAGIGPKGNRQSIGCITSLRGEEIRKISPKTVLPGLDADLPATIQGLLSGKSCGCVSQNSIIKPENAAQSKYKNTPITAALEGRIRVFLEAEPAPS